MGEMTAHRTTLARYVEAEHRTVHLLDLANLAGAVLAAPLASVDRLAAWYGEVLAPGAMDHVVVAAPPGWVFDAADAWRGARVVVRRRSATGTLLADYQPARLAGRYRRAVLASGDGACAGWASECRALGVEVVVVANPWNLSTSLSRSADAVALVPSAVCGSLTRGRPIASTHNAAGPRSCALGPSCSDGLAGASRTWAAVAPALRASSPDDDAAVTNGDRGRGVLATTR
jgi:hypothetical protein